MGFLGLPGMGWLGIFVGICSLPINFEVLERIKNSQIKKDKKNSL